MYKTRDPLLTARSIRIFISTFFLIGCTTTRPVVALDPAATVPPAAPVDRTLTNEGLSWASAVPGVETAASAGGTIVVRVDTRIARLVLLNPEETKGEGVRSVAEEHNLKVAINAAMFSKDYKTSIGYMRNFANVNNPRKPSNLKGYLLFNPVSKKMAGVKIATADDKNYQTAFQTHRVWTPEAGIMWKQGSHNYMQIALVGVDAKDRALFFFHPDLIDVHDMVNEILQLNLGLRGLLYLDGGNHGLLYLSPELGTSYNAGMPIPNVIGVR